jgi:hypothetical protein
MTDVNARISQLERELVQLKTQLLEQSRRNRSISPDQMTPAPPTSRRQLLRLAGAAAVGAAGVSLATAAPAGASTGTMMYGTTNDASSDGTSLSSQTSVPTFDVENFGTGPALRAQAVAGGPGLLATSEAGYGLDIAGGLADIHFSLSLSPGPPTTGSHLAGEL